PVAADVTELPTVQTKINDTPHLWGYCGRTGHSTVGFMVFVINGVPSGTIDFTAFSNLASI
ncbi:hypothetical protein GALMADRAFT_1344937, partial [Galerina marginata CBS 339.88]